MISKILLKVLRLCKLMRFFVLLFCFSFMLFAKNESFITDVEYAKMLFKNPRGVGCDKCHGEKGEGSLISLYKDLNSSTQRYDEKELRAPAINNLDFETFSNALKSSKGVMPSYFLTDEEVDALYGYVNEKERIKREEKRKEEIKNAEKLQEQEKKEEQLKKEEIAKTQTKTAQIKNDKKDKKENLKNKDKIKAKPNKKQNLAKNLKSSDVKEKNNDKTKEKNSQKIKNKKEDVKNIKDKKDTKNKKQTKNKDKK